MVNGMPIHGCMKLRKMVQGNTIDENCPLPNLDDAEEMVYEKVTGIFTVKD